jgi:hypothetical protein
MGITSDRSLEKENSRSLEGLKPPREYSLLGGILQVERDGSGTQPASRQNIAFGGGNRLQCHSIGSGGASASDGGREARITRIVIGLTAFGVIDRFSFFSLFFLRLDLN